jgi:hypothetical protein
MYIYTYVRAMLREPGRIYELINRSLKVAVQGLVLLAHPLYKHTCIHT